MTVKIDLEKENDRNKWDFVVDTLKIFVSQILL